MEDLLAERGVVVSYETIRRWCRKFGQGYANALRRRGPRPGDTWHLVVAAFTLFRHLVACITRTRAPHDDTG